MSNEKKIIKEMVQGNLKVHRKRNMLLVLAITLTTILFTSVLEIGFGGMQSIQETQLKLSGMKADAELRFLDKEQFQKVQNSDLFESVGGRVPIALMEGETKLPIEIDYLDQAGMEAYYISLEEGKVPENEKEVILSEQALEELGIKKEVGSHVPVSFTLRGQGKYDIEKQHKMHKLHAIERIKYLLDDNSFHEYGSNIGSYGEEYECEKSFPYDGEMLSNEEKDTFTSLTDGKYNKGFNKVFICGSKERNVDIENKIINILEEYD